jgi:hypothetical protein
MSSRLTPLWGLKSPRYLVRNRDRCDLHVANSGHVSLGFNYQSWPIFMTLWPDQKVDMFDHLICEIYATTNSVIVLTLITKSACETSKKRLSRSRGKDWSHPETASNPPLQVSARISLAEVQYKRSSTSLCYRKWLKRGCPLAERDLEYFYRVLGSERTPSVHRTGRKVGR